jgi:hypothetical protein
VCIQMHLSHKIVRLLGHPNHADVDIEP